MTELTEHARNAYYTYIYIAFKNILFHYGLSQDTEYSSLCYTISSVQFSRSVVSDSLRPHELQHARPPCPSPTPRVYPNP